MRLLADENIDAEWIRALADNGHDIVRAVDAAPLEIGDLDPAVLAAATALNRVLLTADRSDFARHATTTLGSSSSRRSHDPAGAPPSEDTSYDLTGTVASLGDWL